MLGYPDKAYECTGWRKKRGHHLIENILKFHDRIAWKLVNFYNIIMLNTVINFLFKNFIALWRHHIAEVHQLSRNSIMKFSEYFQWDRPGWPRFFAPLCMCVCIVVIKSVWYWRCGWKRAVYYLYYIALDWCALQVRPAGLGSQTRLALQLNKAKKSVSSDDSYIKRANCVGAVGYAVVLPDERIPPNDFFRTNIRFRIRLRYRPTSLVHLISRWTCTQTRDSLRTCLLLL